MELVHTKDYLLLIDKKADLEKNPYFLWKDEVHKFHSDNGYGIKTYTDFDPEDESSLIVNWSNKHKGSIIASLPEIEGLPLLPPFEEDYEKVYVLLADGDGTMRSSDEPFGVAVKTKEAAEQYLKDGGVGYSHSYEELRVFDTAKEGIDWKYRKIQPLQSHSKQYSLEQVKDAIWHFLGSETPYEEVALKFDQKIEEYLELLSTPKVPKEFIPEGLGECTVIGHNGTHNEFGTIIYKTETNSEGKQIIKGTYKY